MSVKAARPAPHRMPQKIEMHSLKTEQDTHSLRSFSRCFSKPKGVQSVLVPEPQLGAVFAGGFSALIRL